METCDKNIHLETESTPRPLGNPKAWLKRAKQVIPGCAQTFSKSPMAFVQNVAPNFLLKAEGAYVWDLINELGIASQIACIGLPPWTPMETIIRLI